jgi:hypothetical protein
MRCARTRRRVLILFLAYCQLMSGCAESFFDLASDSRLPKWFTVPVGLSRKDVVVTMAYYDLPSGRSATFKLWDSNGRKLAQLSATVWPGGPRSLGKLNPPRGVEKGAYPVYEIVTANGVIEVLEQKRMEPLLYVSDDPEVKRALGLNK